MRDSCLPEPLPLMAPDLEQYLLHQRAGELAGLGLPGDLTLPCYGLSVANLPATLAALLGGRLAGAQPPLPGELWADLAPGVRRVVWITINAVGWQTFQRLLQQETDLLFARLARAGRLVPITSVLPTATTSALISMWTGYSPAQHGMVGHMMYLREYGLVADMLMLSPAGGRDRDQLVDRGLVLEEFLPVPGMGTALARQGIVTRVLMNRDLVRTGFSRLCLRGVEEVERFVTAIDMCVRLRQVLEANPDERLLLAGYLAEVDVIGHLHGAESDSWRAELRALAWALEREFLQRLSHQERQGTILVLTADHGQLLAPAISVVLADHPGLAGRLLLPAMGSLRAAYLYACQGQVGQARAYLEQRLAGQFAVVTSEAALRAGLLGPGEPTPETGCRLGDLIVLGRDGYMLDYRRRTHPARGMHAGASPQEMLVPLLLARLD